MKALLTSALIVLAAQASASHTDFDRINEFVEKKVVKVANEYLQGENEVTDIEEVSSRGLKTTYKVFTETSCELKVTSGFAFRTKVVSTKNCL